MINPVEQMSISELNKIPEQYQQYSRVFSKEAVSHEFPPSCIWDHTIEPKPGALVSLPRKLIPLSQPELEELRKFVKEHLIRGTVRPSKSPYTASFFFIKKKDGKLCPVQDYHPINNWTIKNKYPLPLIPQLVDQLRGCSLYTKFDIRWGYNNVHIKEGEEWKAAFMTNKGLFELTIMFFRLTNSPATFQMIMNLVFAPEIVESWLIVYMDNMAIHTAKLPNETDQQHLLQHYKLVNQILAKLQEHNLFLKPEKCTFEQPAIKFLKVKVNQGTVQMDDTKIVKVQNWITLNSVMEVCKFLGFTGYYHYFIQDYLKKACPLLYLTHNTTPWQWENNQQTAFETLQDAMCSKPVL